MEGERKGLKNGPFLPMKCRFKSIKYEIGLDTVRFVQESIVKGNFRY